YKNDIGKRARTNTETHPERDPSHPGGNRNDALLKAAIRNLILILSPFTPHICEEMWEGMGQAGFVFGQEWPSYDADILARDTVEIVVQINGKVKEKLSVAGGLGAEELIAEVAANEKVRALTADKTVLRMIGVPDKLVNIVVGKG
ncbi:MAG: class I tRNA ligase family protein, partial [Clostridiales Family XIII bacterium]|nr:class I tRNA ligase family protein [Clostridiales Family XIII bacterium]